MKHPRIANIVIVLIFATLHLSVAMLSRALEYQDDIMLTVLTITMVIIVSMRNHTRADIMAILTLVATLLGYIIGSWLWQPLSQIIDDEFIAPAISTFLITTVVGLAVNALTLRVKRFRSTTNVLRSYVRNVILVAVGILLVRLLYVVMFRVGVFNEGTLLSHVFGTLENTWALLTLIAGNVVLFAYLSSKDREASKRLSFSKSLTISLLTLPVFASLLIYFDIPHFELPATEPLDFVRTLSAALLIDILIATVCILIRISTISQRELREERELKHRTEYQYERLKQQINPHFLFNSLGILDYLVQEHETERASAFIRKLAGIYRYMLNNDQKPLVKISEELEFTMKYIDLLKERFIEGMEFEIDIEEQHMNDMVVPCSLQLLVENATKHNIVSAESPLRVRITTENNNNLVVRNNLQPRTHGQPSTNLGLRNIRQQYLDVAASDISIEKSDSEFIVKLPIV